MEPLERVVAEVIVEELMHLDADFARLSAEIDMIESKIERASEEVEFLGA